MSPVTTKAAEVARRKALPKTTPVRLTDDAVRVARIASGYTGESMAEYVSRVVVECGERDIDRLHAEMAKGKGKGSPKP